MIKKRKILYLGFALLTLTILSVVLAILAGRSGLYHYDVSDDYFYDLQGSEQVITPLTLTRQKIEIPGFNGNSVTALLKLRIQSRLLGRLFQPHLKLSTNGNSIQHYFEHAAAGMRYLDISALISSLPTTVSIEASFLGIQDQRVDLVTFHNSFDKDKKMLVLAPHPDDAEIAAYGLYSSSNMATIVTVTAGDAGKWKYDEVYDDSVIHYRKKGQLRVWNSVTVPLLGGVSAENAINLGYFDGTLKNMYQNKTSKVRSLYSDLSDIEHYRQQNISKMIAGLKGEPTWTSLVHDFEFLINTITPEIIVAPYPAIDRHSDHKLTTIALIEAIRNIQYESGKLYLYTNHHPKSELYPFGPMGGAISLPPNFNSNLFVRAIYSHSLDNKTRKDKLMALEAMHDLRLDTEWLFLSGVTKLAYLKVNEIINGNDIGFFRRAVRSNELFFLINVADLYIEEYTERVHGTLALIDGENFLSDCRRTSVHFRPTIQEEEFSVSDSSKDFGC